MPRTEKLNHKNVSFSGLNSNAATNTLLACKSPHLLVTHYSLACSKVSQKDFQQDLKINHSKNKSTRNKVHTLMRKRKKQKTFVITDVKAYLTLHTNFLQALLKTYFSCNELNRSNDNNICLMGEPASLQDVGTSTIAGCENQHHCTMGQPDPLQDEGTSTTA